MPDLKTQLSRGKRKLIYETLKVTDLITGGRKHLAYDLFRKGFHNPNYTFNREKIALVHLPKTAGTSLSDLLENDSKERFVNLDIHKPVSQHCPPEHFKYITIMRDPVDRVWSQYQMVLRNPAGSAYKKYAEKGLNSFIKSNIFVQNLCCRYLSGDMKSIPDSKMFEQAKLSLNFFYSVLPFDAFTNSVTIFLENHEITFESIPNKRNASYNRPTKEEIQCISNVNKWDIKLFEHWKSNP